MVKKKCIEEVTNNTLLSIKEIARESAPRSDSKLKTISTTRLNPKHHLWYVKEIPYFHHLNFCFFNQNDSQI